jgi:hypothetical protein
MDVFGETTRQEMFCEGVDWTKKTSLQHAVTPRSGGKFEKEFVKVWRVIDLRGICD